MRVFRPPDGVLFKDPRGPIQSLSWGLFTIQGEQHGWDDGAGRVGAGKDIRIIDGVVTPWLERKGHRLTRSMVMGVWDPPVEVLIIGTGVYGRITCPRRLIDILKAEGISDVFAEPTPDACRRYNDLVETHVRAALLAHGTC